MGFNPVRELGNSGEHRWVAHFAALVPERHNADLFTVHNQRAARVTAARPDIHFVRISVDAQVGALDHLIKHVVSLALTVAQNSVVQDPEHRRYGVGSIVGDAPAGQVGRYSNVSIGVVIGYRDGLDVGVDGRIFWQDDQGYIVQ